MPVTSIFFSHNVFNAIKDKSIALTNMKLILSVKAQFGFVQNFVL